MISGSMSSTSLMRLAEAAARGSITNITVTMSTANRICIAYCRKAIIAPTCISGVDPDGAEPDDGDAGQVEHQHQRRHQDRHQAVDGDGGVGQVEVGEIEAALFVWLAIEGADDAHAGQTFVQHEVQPVDLDLHDLEQRHGPAHDEQEDEHQDRYGDGQHPGQRRVLREGQMTPPIAIIGAVITIVSSIISTVCTWVVSLVVRVISEAVPKASNSCSENCRRA